MAELHHSLNKFTTVTGVPHDIASFHILPRLPAKSLFRFMCVCKQWHSFINTPMFAKMQLLHITKDDLGNDHKLSEKCIVQHKQLLLSIKQPCMFSTINCEAPEDGLTATRLLPFEGSLKYMSILTTLNGLVCVRVSQKVDSYKYSDLILWNPLTGDSKKLSKSCCAPDEVMVSGKSFCLYYDSPNDDYKILRVSHRGEVYIYSLNTDSWRKVESIVLDFQHRYNEWTPAGTSINEALYFLKIKTRRGYPFDNMQEYSIMKFDLNTEKFMEIAGPPLANLKTDRQIFTVFRGCIHIFVSYEPWNRNESVCHAWRMDRDGVWVMLDTYSSREFIPWYYEPLHLMRNGNWLMHSESGEFFYKLDLDKLTEERVGSYYTSGMRILPQGKYIETLVSPNR